MNDATLETIDGRPALRFERTLPTRSSACGERSASRRSYPGGSPRSSTGCPLRVRASRHTG